MNKQRSWFILFFLIPTGIVFFSGNVLAQNIVTGDATSITVICNDVNNTSGEGPCTATPTPTPELSPTRELTPTPTESVPTPTSQPTPTPTPTQPPIGGGGGEQQAGGGGGGEGGGSVSAPQSQGEVLGLAATASGKDALWFYTIGVLCLALGSALMRPPKQLLA